MRCSSETVARMPNTDWHLARQMNFQNPVRFIFSVSIKRQISGYQLNDNNNATNQAALSFFSRFIKSLSRIGINKVRKRLTVQKPNGFYKKRQPIKKYTIVKVTLKLRVSVNLYTCFISVCATIYCSIKAVWYPCKVI